MRRIFLMSIIFISCRESRMNSAPLTFNDIIINLEVKKCIDINKLDSVTFIVRNNNKFGFWINSWNLFLDSITTKDSIVVSSKSLIEYKHPNIPEHYWVEANSAQKISYSTDFFLRASLNKLTEYNLYASYKSNAGIKKNTKEITLIHPVEINKITFWTCP